MPRCGSLVGAAHPGRNRFLNLFDNTFPQKNQQRACCTKRFFSKKTKGFFSPNWTCFGVFFRNSRFFFGVFFPTLAASLLDVSSGRRPGGVGCPAPPRVRCCGAGRGVCCRGAGVRWTAWCFTWLWISARPEPKRQGKITQSAFILQSTEFFRSWYANICQWEAPGSSQEKDN